MRRDVTIPWKAVAAVVFVGQLVWLLLVSVHIRQRFSLTSDYALFYQAWHLIAGGHLSPTSTIYRTNPFLENHFELLIYPLALFEFIDPSGFILLVLQDLATVAAELVAFFWVIELVHEYWGAGTKSREIVLGGGLIVLAADPWIWWSSAFDFHFQAFATLFSLLALRSFWNRRWVPAAAWTLLTLCCGTVESVVLIGLGLGLIISQRGLWRQGVALAGATIAWLLTFDALGYNKGSQLSSLYGYLTNSAPGTQVRVTQVVFGVLRHPHLVWSMVKMKRTYLWQTVAGAGLLGVFSSIGLPVAAVLFIPAVLNAQLSVVQPEAAFQVLPLLLIVPVGSVLVLCWLSRRRRPWRIAASVLGTAALAEALIVAAIQIPKAAPYFVRTDAAAAAVLRAALARTPPGAEVIVSNGFIGPFANRPFVYSVEAPVGGGSVPVRARVVEFVLSARQGLETTPIPNTQAAIGQIRHRLHATLILDSAGISVLVWHPPPGVHRVSLPGL